MVDFSKQSDAHKYSLWTHTKNHFMELNKKFGQNFPKFYYKPIENHEIDQSTNKVLLLTLIITVSAPNLCDLMDLIYTDISVHR